MEMLSRRITLFFLILILFLTSACTAGTVFSPSVTATPYPTPDIVRLTYAPAVRPSLPAVQVCADAHPEIALFLYEIPASSSDVPDGLRLWLGEPTEGMSAYQLAEESLVVIAHADSTVGQLQEKQLEKIFSREWQTWAEISQSDGETERTIQVWTYPRGNELRSAFYTAIAGGEINNGFANLAPDPGAMLEAVSGDPDGIGYLPGAWLDESVQAVPLARSLLPALRMPLLAVLDREPNRGEKTLLACLQSGVGQGQLAQIYP